MCPCPTDPRDSAWSSRTTSTLLSSTLRCGCPTASRRGALVGRLRRRTTSVVPACTSPFHRSRGCGAPTTTTRRCGCRGSSPGTLPNRLAAQSANSRTGMAPSSARSNRPSGAGRLTVGTLNCGRGRRGHAAVDGGLLDGRPRRPARKVGRDLRCADVVPSLVVDTCGATSIEVALSGLSDVLDLA
jgi:hypothetical protein